MATDVSWEYKRTAARVLAELEKTLGKDLEEEEKFMFVHGTAECSLPEAPESVEKCPARCREESRLASLALENNNPGEALSHLNTAVRFAPTTSTTTAAPASLADLATALFSRSQVLLTLGQPELALRDAELAAIKGAFPEARLFCLYSHQAQCQLALRATFQAEKYFHRALSALAKSELEPASREREKTFLQRALSSLKKDGPAKPGVVPGGKTAVTGRGGKNKTEPDIARPLHAKYPALSGQLSVLYSQGRGRYVSAREDITAGTVLGVETALVSSLQEDHLLARCLHCFTEVLAGLPCHSCAQVVFCSLQCRLSSMSSHHKFECRNLHLIKSGPNFLALRAVTQRNVEYFLERRVSHFSNYDDSSGTELEGPRPYLSTDTVNLFNLARKEVSSEKKMELFMIAAYLLKVLQQMKYFEGEKKNEKSLTEEEVYIGMILAHFVGVTESNSHLICEVPRDQLNFTSLPDILRFNFEPQQIGFGINPTLAFFNHSCNPNTIKIQRGNRTILMAAQNIEKGEEIFDNYGSLFYTSERAARLRDLGFSCGCEPCAEDWPRYQKLSDKITDPPLGSVPGNITENTRKQLEKGRAANSLMKKMSYELSAGHHGRVLALSGDYRSLLEKIVRQPHRFYFNNYMIMFYSYWIKHGNKAS